MGINGDMNIDMDLAERRKAEGNALFAQRSYDRCLEAYSEAVGLLGVGNVGDDEDEHEDEDEDGDENKDAGVGNVRDAARLRLLLQVYANRSLAYLRLGRWDCAAWDGARASRVVGAFGASISADDCAVADKAAYRRGLALCMMGEAEAGVGACGGVRGGGELDGAVRLLMGQLDVVKAWGAWKEGLAPSGVTPAVARLVWLLWRDVLGEDEGDEGDEGDEENGQNGQNGEGSGGASHSSVEIPLEDSMSPVDMLEMLAEQLHRSSASADRFHIISNLRLFFYLMNSMSTRAAVCRVLNATVDVAVVWPRELWAFLAGCACGKKAVGGGREDVEGYAGDCMGVLLRVAEGNAWVRQWVLTACWGGERGGASDVLDGTSILGLVSKTIGTCHLSARCVGKDAVGTGCGVLAAYAASSDEASVAQLVSVREVTVVMHMLSAFENAREIVWGSGDDDNDSGEVVDAVSGDASVRLGGGGPRGAEDENEQAKRALIKKQRAVYDPATIELQKEILSHLRAVFKCKPLMMSELVEWKGGRKCASQVHHRLVALGKLLVSRCPKRSTKVYDGLLNIVSYEKKAYAADFNDNPAGDFLATIDLEGLASAAGRDLSASPVLDEFLETMMVLFEHGSSFITGLMFKAGVLSLCQTLSAFVSLRTVRLAQSICWHVLHVVAEARDELLESSNVILMAGLLVGRNQEGRSQVARSVDAGLVTFALGELARVVPSCSGNDLKYLMEKESGLIVFLQENIAHGETGQTGGDVTGLTAELARRAVACGNYRVLRTGNKIPKGYGWGDFDAELLESVMYPLHGSGGAALQTASAAGTATPTGQLGPGFARGFFPKANASRQTISDTDSRLSKAAGPGTSQASTAARTAEPSTETAATSSSSSAIFNQTTPDARETTPSSRRCEVVELNSDDDDNAPAGNAPSSHPEVSTAPAAVSDDSDDSDCELYEVHEIYDSTPAEHIREARAAWMAMSQAEKVSWEQTSSDVMAKVKVPRNTSARDVSVTCTSTSITVNLKWYGKVLDGALFGGIKAHEFTWCLNDDSEVYIVLPKDSKEHWWKTLIQGWEEKGYYELLKDAVDADEPHVAYDDMDDSAKDLLDSMLERQSYINSGMLDLENGFDDFRIVLSDSSLRDTST